MKIRGIAGNKGARRAGMVWGVIFLAAVACGPAFPATLEWGTYLGGSGNDHARGVALDGDGNLYVVGNTYSTGWVSGGWDTVLNDGVSTSGDGFLVKLSPTGVPVWSTYLGGAGIEVGEDVALDGEGNIYVAGYTASADWVSGGWDTVLNDGVSTSGDGFLVKLSPAGAHVWSTYLGGSKFEWAYDVAAGGDGSIFVAGYTLSANWVSGGWDALFNDGAPTDDDGFLVKLSPSGAHEWSTYLGGAYSDRTNGVAVDADGNVFAVGSSESPGWVSGGWDTLCNDGAPTYEDGFLVKLSPSGAHEWSTYLGGALRDGAIGVAVDGDGGVVVCGSTTSPGWVSGSPFTVHAGDWDGFVARFSPSGGHEWSGCLGGDYADRLLTLALDAGGDVYAAGTTDSPGWVSGGWNTVFNQGSATGYDGVVLRLSAAGDRVWSSYVGGASYEYAYGVAVAVDGAMVVVGETASSGGWIADGYDVTHNGGMYDGFAVKVVQTEERGALRVTLAPPEAVAEGARWRRVGTSGWHGSGELEEGVYPGEWGVEFLATTEWAAPPVQSVTVTAGETAELTATYIANWGALRVTIAPSEAVAAGAQWRRVGMTSWFDSGAVESGVPGGDWQVEFKPLPSWVVPSVQTVTVTAGTTVEASGEYTPLFGSTPRREAWITDGPVFALATTPTTTYVGGDFHYVGPNTGSYAALDLATGVPAPPHLKVNGEVRACVSDGAGGWYIGGEFTRVGLATRNRIAHILPGGTLDPAWNPDANSAVYCLAVSGTTVYAGGTFSAIGGQTRNRIAALDVATGTATAWNPNTNRSVYCLAVSGTTVYAGGAFTVIGGQTRNLIAALDAATGAATAWNPNAGVSGPGVRMVSALAVSGATVYAGGDFSTIGGQVRHNIAALDAATGTATTWRPSLGGKVFALAVSGATVYAGGDFTYSGRNRIAALDAVTGATTAWDPNADGAVHCLAVSGTTVYAGGDFGTIGGQARHCIAALDAVTGAATEWTANTTGRVNTLAVSETAVHAGGNFRSIGGGMRNNLAVLDAVTGTVTDWYPNPSGPVYSLAMSGTTLYVGGAFGWVGSQTRNGIAALDTVTRTLTAWDANANAYSRVNALAVSGTAVYAGGTFTTIGGQTRNRIAALDLATGTATAWNPNANGTVNALAVSGSMVYAGGAFTTIGGQARNRIAALDAAVNTNNATAWNPNANGAVGTLAVSGTTVYAGGSFTTIGGQTRNRIAALNAAVNTNNATAWDPNAGNTVNALAVSGSMVYAGGRFAAIGGQTRNLVAELSATANTNNATAWNPNAENATTQSVSAVAVSGTAVHVGGSFTTIGGELQPCLAQFDAPAGPVAPTNPGAALIGTDRITWTWQDNSTEEILYKVYSDPGAGPPATLYFAAANALGWEYLGLTPNTLYSFQAAATNAAGDSEKTTNFFAWTLAAVAAAPVVSNPTSSTLNVTLGADSNPAPTPYAIQVSPEGGGGAWVQADGRVGPTPIYRSAAAWGTVTVTGLAPMTLHFFTVTARNWDGVNAAEGPAGMGTTTQPPSPPSNPGATAVGADTITWTWVDNSADEAGFKVWADPGAGAPVTLQVTTATDATAWTQGGLPSNTLHTFQVAATNAEGDSEKTAPFSVWTLAAVPAAPVVGNPSVATLDVAVGAGDGNPAGTEYALRHVTTGRWVQADGTRGWTAVWRTAADWGAVTVSGLEEYTEHTFAALARNGVGVETAAGPSASGMTLDATPPTGTVAVNGGAAHATAPDVTLTLSHDDGSGSGVADMRFSNEDLVWSGWKPAGGTAPWTLSPGDGAKTVCVQFRDAAGNVSADALCDDILLETTPPTAAVTLLDPTPTQAAVLRYGVVFSESVAPTFTVDDVSLTGALAGTASVDGADPSYTVTVTLTGGNPDGLTGIALGTDVQDAAGNGFAGALSPQYDVVWWPGFAAPPAGSVLGYAGDPGPVLDASVAAGAPRIAAYQWWRDDGTKSLVPGPATAVWDLGTLSPALDGVYWCSVSYGGFDLATVPVEVRVRNRIALTAQPADQTVVPGGTAVFTVSAAGGYTPLRYQWQINGADAPGSPDAAAWTLENVTAGQAGAYSVVMSDSHSDTEESGMAVLKVEANVPAAGLLGLAALAGALAVAGRQRRGLRG